MARTVSEIVIEAPASAVMAVIADFESYPEWATGMKAVEILEADASGTPRRVDFTLDAPPIRDQFVLVYQWHSPTAVEWHLEATSDGILKMMDGSYTLAALEANRTQVTYQLAVDVTIPLLGMLKRKAERVIVDTALKGLKRRVEAA